MSGQHRLRVTLRRLRTAIHCRAHSAAEALPWVKRRHQLDDEVAVLVERLGEAVGILQRLERDRELRAAGGLPVSMSRPAITAAAVAAVCCVLAGCTGSTGSLAGAGSTSGQQAASSSASGAPATSPRRAASSSAPHAKPAAGCRSGDPLANVYHEDRLVVRKACMTVTGTVAYVAHEDDGDVHVDLALPASEASLLNSANYSQQDGQLVTEIVPADEPGCPPGQPPKPPSGTYNYGICTGADLATPPLGATVRETGPYVLDQDHGWMEIHPVWSITILAARAAPPPAAPAPPTAQSAWCSAIASPANDGYTGDYNVSITSDEPGQKATASDAGDTWSGTASGSGAVTITLWHQTPGETINVTVGSASCSTAA